MRIILLALLLWTSGCHMLPTDLAPALPEIKLEVAKKWQKQCENYFFWRKPTIVAYRGGNNHELLPPIQWCRQESMVFMRDQLPHDYIRDITNRT